MNFLVKYSSGAIHQLKNDSSKLIVIVSQQFEEGSLEYFRVCPISFEIEKRINEPLLKVDELDGSFFIENWNEIPVSKELFGDYIINISPLLEDYKPIEEQRVELSSAQKEFRKREILEYRPLAQSVFVTEVGKNRPYLAIAAMIVLLIASFFVIDKLTKSKVDYYTAYYIRPSLDFLPMEIILEDNLRGNSCYFENLDPHECVLAEQALEQFKHEAFKKSIASIDSILNRDYSKSFKLSFIQSIALLESGDAKSAIEILSKIDIPTDAMVLRDEVDFYLALAYLKTDEIKKAKIKLDQIISLNSGYSYHAKEILSQLE